VAGGLNAQGAAEYDKFITADKIGRRIAGLRVSVIAKAHGV